MVFLVSYETTVILVGCVSWKYIIPWFGESKSGATLDQLILETHSLRNFDFQNLHEDNLFIKRSVVENSLPENTEVLG